MRASFYQKSIYLSIPPPFQPYVRRRRSGARATAVRGGGENGVCLVRKHSVLRCVRVFHLPFELVLHLFGIAHGELRVGSRAVLGATGDVFVLHGGQTGAGEQVL